MGDPHTKGGLGGNGWVWQDVVVSAAPEEAMLSTGEVIGVNLFGSIANCTGGGGPLWGRRGIGEITVVGTELASEPEGRDGHSVSTTGERRSDGLVISTKGDGVLSWEIDQ